MSQLQARRRWQKRTFSARSHPADVSDWLQPKRVDLDKPFQFKKIAKRIAPSLPSTPYPTLPPPPDLGQTKTKAGKIRLAWEVGAEGMVTNAKLRSASPGTEAVGNCSFSRLRGWRFPDPPQNSTYAVEYPFVFVDTE